MLFCLVGVCVFAIASGEYDGLCDEIVKLNHVAAKFQSNGDTHGAESAVVEALQVFDKAIEVLQ